MGVRWALRYVGASAEPAHKLCQFPLMIAQLSPSPEALIGAALLGHVAMVYASILQKNVFTECQAGLLQFLKFLHAQQHAILPLLMQLGQFVSVGAIFSIGKLCGLLGSLQLLLILFEGASFQSRNIRIGQLGFFFTSLVEALLQLCDMASLTGLLFDQAEHFTFVLLLDGLLFL